MSSAYRSALHGRMSQIMGDAIEDRVMARNPTSRKTSPPAGKPKCYCATTEQMWALHDAMPDHLQVAILLGSFAGLRIAEASGLRVDDVSFPRGIVHPKQQWGRRRGADRAPGPNFQPLKTDGSDAPIPIPQDLSLVLAASVKEYGTDMMVTDGHGKPCGPWMIERAFAESRKKVEGLPKKFTFHDLRHYFASLLIADGADIKTVQARLRHAKATTTLDVYGHPWPDADESTRATVGAVIKARMETPADDLRTINPS